MGHYSVNKQVNTNAKSSTTIDPMVTFVVGEFERYEKFHADNEDKAMQVYNALKESKFVVDDLATKRSKSRPSPPFITSTLQQAAANRLTNAALDPVSGIPEYKVCAVKISKAA